MKTPAASKPKSTAATTTAGKPEVRIFVSYSHADAGARAKLETHLAALKRDGVTTWYDGDLNAGDALDRNIGRHLRQAHIFVALLSPEYLASNYCWKIEYQRAMSRRARGLMRVVAVVVRPCDWKETRAAGFKLLPKDGRAVTSWRPADGAYLDIVRGIRGVVNTVRREMTAAPPVAQTKAVKTSPPVKKTRRAPTDRVVMVVKPKLPAKASKRTSIAKAKPAQPARKKR